MPAVSSNLHGAVCIADCYRGPEPLVAVHLSSGRSGASGVLRELFKITEVRASCQLETTIRLRSVISPASHSSQMSKQPNADDNGAEHLAPSKPGILERPLAPRCPRAVAWVWNPAGPLKSSRPDQTLGLRLVLFLNQQKSRCFQPANRITREPTKLSPSCRGAKLIPSLDYRYFTADTTTDRTVGLLPELPGLPGPLTRPNRSSTRLTRAEEENKSSVAEILCKASRLARCPRVSSSPRPYPHSR